MKKQSTIDLFNKYMKKGKLDKFNNYLIENNLRDKFIEDATWYRPYQYKNNTDKLEESLNNYTLMLLKDDACKKYGELGDKFCKYIYNQENRALKRSNMFLLDRILKSSNYTNLDNVSQVFDMACDENNVIGTHITGSQIGDIISDEGIVLTGHKFAATDSLINNNIKSVKGTLEKNITFFKNQPFELLWNLTSGRNYNNNTRENFNDIMLVSIPENELNNNRDDIIIQNNSSLYLNPSYIKGYAKINTVDGDIKDIKENPRFINKNYHELYNQRESNYDDYRQKLDQWYKDINTTKFGKIFSKVKGIFSKKENKMLPAGNGNYKNPNYSTPGNVGTSLYDELKSYNEAPENIYTQDLENSFESYHRDKKPNELDDRY